MRIMRIIVLAAGVLAESAQAGGRVNLCDSDVQQQTRFGDLNFANAVATGGIVTFECAPNSVLQITRKHRLTRPVEIIGNGVILDAKNTTVMFEAPASASPVVLRNLTLRNGSISSGGGLPGGLGIAGAFFGAVKLTLNRVNVETTTHAIAVKEIIVYGGHFSNNTGWVISALTAHISNRAIFSNNDGAPLLAPFFAQGNFARIEDAELHGNAPITCRPACS